MKNTIKGLQITLPNGMILSGIEGSDNSFFVCVSFSKVLTVQIA